MSRSVSAVFAAAAHAPQTEEVLVILITIDHDDLANPIRISTDNGATFVVDGTTYRGTISNGENYTYCPVRVVLPDDSEETISQCTLEIDNVDRDILASIRTITSAPSMTLQVVLASSPDTTEAYYPNFTLSSIYADAMIISGTMSLGDFLSEPFPGGSMLPSNFPGLF